MRRVVADLREKAAQVSWAAARRRAKHTARGKLLPRDRVDHLLDRAPASNSASWPPTACTTTTPRRPA
jgi:acetyl-CoA carboxylase carboxyltransferase component